VFIFAHTRQGTHREGEEEKVGSWEFTTIKDRERPTFEKRTLRDFGLEYIKKVARVS